MQIKSGSTLSYQTKMLTTDLIINVYNKQEIPDQQKIMWECIHAIYDRSDKYHLILIENGSTDDTFERLMDFKEDYGNCTILHEDTHRGLCMGRNMGYVASQHEHIIWMDPDVIVKTRHWNRILAEKFLEHEGLGIVAPLTNVTGLDQQRSDGKDLPREDVFVPRLIPGLVMCSSHSVVEELREAEKDLAREPCPGLFDIKYPAYGCDDYDWGDRLWLIKKKLLVVGSVFVYHYGGIGAKSLEGDKLVDALRKATARYGHKF